jgi:hypothetical protein
MYQAKWIKEDRLINVIVLQPVGSSFVVAVTEPGHQQRGEVTLINYDELAFDPRQLIQLEEKCHVA